MAALILRRLLQLLPMLLLVTVIVFALIRLAPFDVIDSITTPQMSEETKDAMRAKFGLDQPMLVQYGLWLSNAVQGDLGFSLVSRHPISADLLTRIPNTIALILPAYITAVIVAVLLGRAAGFRRGRLADRIIDGFCSIAIATPSFWFALLIIYVFGYQLRLFPILGMHTVGREGDPLDFLAHFVMPYTVLVLAMFPDLARYVRASTITQLDDDYVLVQRAYGATDREILRRHIGRNTMLPIITQIGLAVPMLATGAIVTETIFAWPGIGQYILQASTSLDYPVILAVLLLSAVLVIIGNLLADVLYVVADPRIRLARRS